MSLTATDRARDGLVGADDDRRCPGGPDDVLRGLQAERPSCRTTHRVGHDLDLGMAGDRGRRMRLERLIEGRGLDRPDVADVAGVGLEVGAGRDDELADLPAEFARDERDVRAQARDLGVGGGHVGAEHLVDVADGDAGVDRLLDVLDQPGAVERLGDDRVVLAGRGRVLELLRLGRRDRGLRRRPSAWRCRRPRRPARPRASGRHSCSPPRTRDRRSRASWPGADGDAASLGAAPPPPMAARRSAPSRRPLLHAARMR